MLCALQAAAQSGTAPPRLFLNDYLVGKKKPSPFPAANYWQLAYYFQLILNISLQKPQEALNQMRCAAPSPSSLYSSKLVKLMHVPCSISRPAS